MPAKNEDSPIVRGQLRIFTGLFGEALRFPFIIADVAPPNVNILYDGSLYILDISIMLTHSEVIKDG